MTRFLLTAACAAAFIAPGLSPAEAQSYSAQSRQFERAPTYEECVAGQRNRQVAGAVIGGVLGAVLGAEIHDDSQDRARNDRRYRDYRYVDRRHRGYRHDRHRRGYRYGEQGQGGAVVAGAGVGALAGAALGGAGDDCRRYARRTGYGYGSAPGHHGAHPGGRGYGHDRYGYERARDDRDYRYDDRYDDRYDTRYDDRYDGGYDGRYGGGSGELLGGPDARRYDDGRNAQVYTASSAQGSATARSTGACRDMRSAGQLVLMCQGADGVWRPADTYR